MIELKSHIGQCALLILADKVRDLISYCSYEYEVLRNDEERRHVLYIRNVKRVARLLIQNIDYELTPHLNDKTMEFFKENDDIAESFVAEVIPEYCGSFDEQITFSDLQFSVEHFVNDFVERLKGLSEYLPEGKIHSSWELLIEKQILTDSEWADLMAALTAPKGVINADSGHARNNQDNRTP